MNCQEFSNELPDLLLTPNAVPSPAAVAHLSTCPPCTEEYVSFQQTFGMLDTWSPVEPTPFFDGKLNARVREIQAAPALSWFERMQERLLLNTGRHFRPAMAGALGLALLLGVGGGSFVTLGHHAGTPGTPIEASATSQRPADSRPQRPGLPADGRAAAGRRQPDPDRQRRPAGSGRNHLIPTAPSRHPEKAPMTFLSTTDNPHKASARLALTALALLACVCLPASAQENRHQQGRQFSAGRGPERQQNMQPERQQNMQPERQQNMQPDRQQGFQQGRQAQGQQQNGFGRQDSQHLGQWMASHRNLSPEQQQRALAAEPGFRQLQPQVQQRMYDRLNQLNRMSPAEQQRTLSRTEQMERLAPQQRQQIRGAMQQLGSLPEDRRRAVAHTYHQLNAMSPEQRGAYMNSPQYRSQFNDQERETVNNLLTVSPYLPQAPRPAQQAPYPQAPPLSKKLAAK